MRTLELVSEIGRRLTSTMHEPRSTTFHNNNSNNNDRRSEISISARYLDFKNLNIIARFCLIHLRPCQHDDGHTDGRSQIKVHADDRKQVHSAQSSLTVTHPSTNRGRRCLTSVNVPQSY